jgi:hypothetical protein
MKAAYSYVFLLIQVPDNVKYDLAGIYGNYMSTKAKKQPVPLNLAL